MKRTIAKGRIVPPIRSNQELTPLKRTERNRREGKRLQKKVTEKGIK